MSSARTAAGQDREHKSLHSSGVPPQTYKIMKVENLIRAANLKRRVVEPSGPWKAIRYFAVGLPSLSTNTESTRDIFGHCTRHCNC
jgi:hypothetical protein